MSMLKKTMIGAFLGAVAIASVQGSASAADFPIENVSVDYQNQVLVIEGTVEGKAEVAAKPEASPATTAQPAVKNDEIMVAYPTLTKAGAWKKLDAWDIYELNDLAVGETGTAYVDISWINPLKGGYVAIKSPTTDPIVIEIGKVSSKYKASYDALKGDTGTVTIKDNGTEVAADALAKGFEVSTTYGTWVSCDFTKQDWSAFLKKGASIVVRKAASESTIGTKEIPGETEDDITYEYGWEKIEKKTVAEVSTYAAPGTFAGKQFKVKIKAVPKAPKAVVQLDKRGYQLKADSMYRIIENGVYGEWKEGKAKDIIEVDALADGVFEVKAKATSKAAASRIGQFAYNALRVVTVAKAPQEEVKGEDDQVTTEAVTPGAISVADNKVLGAEAKEDLTAEITKNSKGALTGIKFTSAGAAYQVVCVDAPVDDVATLFTKLNAKEIKATTVKAGKTASIKKTTCAGKFVYVRYASVKATKTVEAEWASDFVYFGYVPAE